MRQHKYEYVILKLLCLLDNQNLVLHMVNRLNDLLFLYPSSLQEAITVNYIRKPASPQWGYNIINDEAQYDSSLTTDFELHPSEETKLVFKILQLAGVAMKDNNLYQIGSAEDNKNIQQEKR